MAEFYWTAETAFNGYTLRNARGGPQAVVTQARPRLPWFGSLLVPGLPASPPCPTRVLAASWVEVTMVQRQMAEMGDRFGELP